MLAVRSCTSSVSAPWSIDAARGYLAALDSETGAFAAMRISRSSVDDAPMFCWRFGTCVVDEAAATLTRNGETIPLSRSLFLMLLHFLQHPQVVQTKAELFDALWPGRVD